jgi:amino acid adenylation domain-containing protein
LRLGGVGVEVVPVGTGTSKFDVSVSVSMAGGGWQGVIEYDTDLFDRSTIERFARDLIGVCEQFAHDPTARASTIAIGATEITQRTRHTRLDTPDRCIHQLIEDQTDRTPHAPAVRDRGTTTTYRELDERANALAHHLTAHGARPGTLVAIRLERSTDLVTALLATLKSGAGYLPLDPRHPAERAAAILRDARPVTTVDLTTPLHQLPPAPRPANSAHPTDTAYVIYTSGSTGTPKGVVIEHRNVTNLLHWARHHLGPATTAPWTAFHSYSFDYSVWETFTPLAHGGTTVIVPDDTRDPATYVELLSHEHIAVASLTPSAFRMLTADPDPWHTHPLNLHTIVFGGEALETHHIPSWFHHLTDAALTNMYGITETTVHATAAPVHPHQQPTLGHPIANTGLHLLDHHLTPVPDGTIGEIHLTGAGLARGYLNQPALTAERFIPNPFGPGRLYRTGDLARYRNGDLEYIGRRDRQIKLRGYRIELAEIEHALGDAHVTVHNGQLTAYTRTPHHPHHLRTLLPDHMIPTTTITIDHWPLTPNGKIDHTALPHPTTTTTPTRPPTALEADLVTAVVADVLGGPGRREQGRADDDFFALGGDSITAIHLVSRAGRLGHSLSARDVFEAPTVAGLAARVTDIGPGTAMAAQGPVPLTPIQSWFFGLDIAQPDHWNQSVSIEAGEELDPQRIEQALQRLVERHDALRLRFRGHEQSLQQIGPVIVCAAATPEDLDAAVAAAQASLDLAAGRVLAAVYCDDRLVLIAHHLVVDAISWGIVVEDLQCLYDGTPLPPASLPFATWARRGHSTPVTPQPNHQGVVRTMVRTADLDPVQATDLVEVLAEVLGEPFDVEGHGRDADEDLTRTVGWFTTITRGAGDPDEVAKVVLNHAGRELPPREGAWRIAASAPAGNRAPANGRPYEVEILAGRRADGTFVLRVDHLRDPGDIERLVDAVLAGLAARRETDRYRPIDFPAAGLTADELGRALDRLLGGG